MFLFFKVQIIIVMSNVDEISANNSSLDVAIFWLFFHKLNVFKEEFRKNILG
jgi:hypothetical protein